MEVTAKPKNGFLERIRKSGFSPPQTSMPTRLTRQDLESLVEELPIEIREDFRQAYLNDWVEQDDQEITAFLEELLPQISQRLQETQGTLRGLALEVSHLARSVTSKQQKREAYNVKEVAEMVGKSEWTVRRWIKDGKLSATRCKERDPFMVVSEDLHEFLSDYGTSMKSLDLS